MNLLMTFDVERDWYRVLGVSRDEYKEKTFAMLEYAIPALIRISNQYGVPCIFFVCGEVAQNVPHLFRDLDPRHTIGIHTHPFTHPEVFKGRDANDHSADLLRNYSCDEQKTMITEDRTLIRDHLGVDSKIFRAGKHGSDATTIRVLDDCDIEIDASINNGYQLIGWTPYTIPGTRVIEIPTYCDGNPELLNYLDRLLSISRRFDMFGNVYSIIFHPMVFGNSAANREKYLKNFSQWIEKCINNDAHFLTIPECRGLVGNPRKNLLGLSITKGIKPVKYIVARYGDALSK